MPTTDHMRRRIAGPLLGTGAGSACAACTALGIAGSHASLAWSGVAGLLTILGVLVFASVRRASREPSRVRGAVVDTLLVVLAERDRETSEHSIRVAELSVRLAARLGFEAAHTERLRLAALLHDIGKVVLDTDILHGHAQLTDDEFDIVRTHPEISARIVRSFVADPMAAEIVLCHHERFDGSGYLGREGLSIPIESHIVAVCDSFDAMTSRRAYHNAMDPQAALAEIERNAGSQFHPAIAEAFLAELGYTPAEVPQDGVAPTSPAGRYNDVVVRPAAWHSNGEDPGADPDRAADPGEQAA